MHIASHGDPTQMAKAIHDALALKKLPHPMPALLLHLPPIWASIRNRSNRLSAIPAKLMAESFSLPFRVQKQSMTRAWWSRPPWVLPPRSTFNPLETARPRLPGTSFSFD